MTSVLTERDFGRARAFLYSRGRPLDVARFQHAFQDGTVGDVLAALRAFQNEDGGFGRALEPDHRAPHSSVLGTLTALRVLHDLHVPEGEPTLVSAVGWLLEELRPAPGGGVWPFLPPGADAFPHAPWWNQSPAGELDRTFHGFRVNPRAELVGLLWRWPALPPEGLLPQLTLETRDAALLGLDPGSTHDHLAAAVFAGVPDVPRDHRLPVLEYLRDVLPGRVQRTPEDFAGYGLNPLGVVSGPASPLLSGLEDAVGAALDHLVAAQDPDGGWRPGWSWFGAFPEDWPQAEADWRSALTLDALLTLRRWDRLEA